MSHRLKITAFTLSEMLVVVLLTVLIVGLSFSVLRLVQKQMYGMEVQYQNNMEVHRLKQALWIDMNKSDQVFYVEKENRLILSNPLQQKYYEFRDNQILGIQDTFYLGKYRFDLYMDNQVQLSGEVDAIHLKIQEQDLLKELFVFKTNSASSYLNR